MKYYPNHHITRTLLGWVIFCAILTLIIGLLYWVATSIIGIIFETNIFTLRTVLCFYLFCLTIISLFTLYINLQVLYVETNLTDNFIFIKYFPHRQEPNLTIMLKEIKHILITTTIKQDKSYNVTLLNGNVISVDLTAIPDKDLVEISDIYDFSINMQTVVD